MEKRDSALPPQAMQPADQGGKRGNRRLPRNYRPDGFGELLAQCPEEGYEQAIAWMAKKLKQNRQVVESWYSPQEFAKRQWPEAFIEQLFSGSPPAQVSYDRVTAHLGSRIRRRVPVEGGLRVETEELNVLLRPTPTGVSLVVSKRGAATPSKSEIGFVGPEGPIPTILG